MRKLNIRAFGLSGGILWGLSVVLITLAATWFNYGEAFVTFMSTFYIGLETTIGGAIVGGIWAFVDGFACGAFFAWLYNRFINTA